MVFNFGFDWTFIAGLLTPVIALLAGLRIDRWRRRTKHFEPPQSEKLLRPPGYSLTREIDRVQDRLLTLLVVSMALCGITAAFMPVFMRTFTANVSVGVKVVEGVFVALVGIPAIVTAARVGETVVKLRNLRLGLSGEQATAEALN